MKQLSSFLSRTMAYLELKKGNMDWRHFPCSIHHITAGLQCIKVYGGIKHGISSAGFGEQLKKKTSRACKEIKSEMIQLIWTMQGGLVGGNLSGEAQRRRAQVQTCLFTVIRLCQRRGAGSCASPGGWRGEIGMRPRNARRSAQTE